MQRARKVHHIGTPSVRIHGRLAELLSHDDGPSDVAAKHDSHHHGTYTTCLQLVQSVGNDHQSREI